MAASLGSNVEPPLPWRRMAWIAAGLALTTFAVFGRAAWEGFDFVRYDDHQYVIDNEIVHGGLTWEGIRWAFRPDSIVVSNWHPLTMLSHMADCQLFGLEAWGHHLTSVLWHIANVVLLFAVLVRLTGALWPSALVGALFAWHPLHVESVAWIAERKDVLSTFCWLAMLWAYASYVRRPAWWSYLPVAFWLTLGLLAKPMLVTAPCTLLLLDYWPLARFRSPGRDEDFDRLGRLLLEKLPLFAIVAGVIAITLGAQSGARMPWEAYSLETRIANGLQSYLAYLGQTVWPQNLAIPYLLSARANTLWRGAAGGVALLAISGGCLALRRTRPYLPVGWFWYLGTLVPVIGIVQVGLQSMADRYTYVPLIGIFIMLAWGLADLVVARPRLKPVLVVATCLWLMVLATLTYRQVGYWRDKISLFQHTADVLERNHVARLYLGGALRLAGRTDEALAEFDRAIDLAPQQFKGHLQKGFLLYRAGRFSAAAAELALAVRLSNGRLPPEGEVAAALLSARVFATHPDSASRNPAVALEMAEHACAQTGYQYPLALDVLAMAYANAGRYPQAASRAIEAREIYRAANLPEMVDEVTDRIRLYQQQQAYRELPSRDAELLVGSADE